MHRRRTPALRNLNTFSGSPTRLTWSLRTQGLGDSSRFTINQSHQILYQTLPFAMLAPPLGTPSLSDSCPFLDPDKPYTPGCPLSRTHTPIYCDCPFSHPPRTGAGL